MRAVLAHDYFNLAVLGLLNALNLGYLATGRGFMAFWTATMVYFLLDTLFVGERGGGPPRRARPQLRGQRLRFEARRAAPPARADAASLEGQAPPRAAAACGGKTESSRGCNPFLAGPENRKRRAGIYPQSVKSPVVILSHHLCTSLYILIPYNYPQYHW
jgi:hypothetical protein